MEDLCERIEHRQYDHVISPRTPKFARMETQNQHMGAEEWQCSDNLR